MEKNNLDEIARKLAKLYGIEVIEKPKSTRLVLENGDVINQDNPNFYKLAFGFDVPDKYTDFEKRQFRLDVKIYKFKTLPYDNYLNQDQLKNFVQIMNDVPFVQGSRKLIFDDDIKFLIQRKLKIFENLEKIPYIEIHHVLDRFFDSNDKSRFQTPLNKFIKNLKQNLKNVRKNFI